MTIVSAFFTERETRIGCYYTGENARIYTPTEGLPPIILAAAGTKAPDLAGRVGQGLITTASNKEIYEQFVLSFSAPVNNRRRCDHDET